MPGQLTAQQKDVIRVVDLQREKNEEHFQRKLPSVHIVPQEQVLGAVGGLAQAEDFLEVVELAAVRGTHPWMSPTTVTGSFR